MASFTQHFDGGDFKVVVNRKTMFRDDGTPFHIVTTQVVQLMGSWESIKAESLMFFQGSMPIMDGPIMDGLSNYPTELLFEDLENRGYTDLVASFRKGMETTNA